MSSYHLPVNIAQTKLSYNIWRLYRRNTSFFGTGKITAFSPSDKVLSSKLSRCLSAEFPELRCGQHSQAFFERRKKVIEMDGNNKIRPKFNGYIGQVLPGITPADDAQQNNIRRYPVIHAVYKSGASMVQDRTGRV